MHRIKLLEAIGLHHWSEAWLWQEDRVLQWAAASHASQAIIVATAGAFRNDAFLTGWALLIAFQMACPKRN